MNTADLYSTRIQKTFDEDHAEIVSILKANPEKVLKLINYYKGLPLSYPASIAAIERDSIDLDVKAEQAFTIEQSRSTFIRSSLFKHDVFAQVLYVNVKKQAASFAKFSYVEIMAERRNFIRLALEPSPDTLIESPQGIIEGNLYDISLSGLNVSIHHSCPLTIDTETSIRFKLKRNEQDVDLQVCVPAKLIAIRDNFLPYSYKFTICPDKFLERKLSQYIFQRQIEIIGEIKDRICQ
ncbi:MAG TPA: PilZ domain-containing protein [Dongiaceae bacterium]|nr:PilZ domain-containing protein [Dongiaceae bacterium]